MNQAASHLEESFKRWYKMKVFWKKGGAKKLLTKENKGLFLDQDIFFWGKGTANVFFFFFFFIMQMAFP